MHTTERRFRRTAQLDPLERELQDVQRAVDRARQNRWYGGDLLQPEFRPVLAAIVAPRPLNAAPDRPCADWRSRRNRWREVLEEVG
jgi:hypothetical protein